jgi:hypothetical protein
MQYIWSALSWFTCSSSTPVNPTDVPVEAPKKSTTFTGWKAWAYSTNSKNEKVCEEVVGVVEEVKDVVKAVEGAVEEIKEAAKEVSDVVDAVKTGDITSIKKEATEAVTTISEVKTALETVLEEVKDTVEVVTELSPVVEDIKTALSSIPEEKVQLVDSDKKKEGGKREDGENGLNPKNVPHD